jgi:signal peptidase I
MNTPVSQNNRPVLNAPGPEEEVYGVGRFLWEIVKILFLAFVIIIPIRVFFFQPFFVQGSSMEPSFEEGEYLIIGEFGYKKTDVGTDGAHLFSVEPFKDLHRQEVVVFHPPSARNSGQFFIKRVIGLPGETVEIRNGKVFVHNDARPEGFQLDESAYLDASVPTFFTATGSGAAFSVKLEEDEYFLMGDNRLSSHDSRAFGPVKKDVVIGKVLLRAWPIGKAQVY